MTAASELLGIVVPALRALLAVPLGVLPRRLWGRFDLPIAGASMVSGLLTMILGGLAAVHLYLDFARRLSSLVADGMIARLEAGGALPVVATAPGLVTAVAFVATPGGLVTGYVVLSGIIRFLAAASDDPQGDPLLTTLDRGLRSLRSRHSRDRAQAARERLEGPAEPDVLLTGKDGGAPEADLVVVASRTKDGWHQGVWVVTSDRWYRLGAPFDRRTAGGLRRFYPLTEVRDLEVIRRSVYYELPRLTEAARDRRVSGAASPEPRSG